MYKTLKILTLLATCAIVANTAHAEKLTFGSWPPAADYYNQVTLPEAFKLIEQETDGQVTWELIAGGQLANGRGSLAAVSDSLMQGGLAIPVYVPDAIPSLTLLYSVTMPGSDPVATAGAANETLFLNCPSCLAGAKKQNVVPLGGFASASYRLMCTSPVASIADMSGKRIRATGGYGALAKQAGATPLSVTLPDAVSLLQRGGLDCLMAAREWLKTFGYGDYAKHVTDLPLGTTGPAIGLYMNRDAFAALTPAQKVTHLKAGALITARHTIGNYIERDNATFAAQQKDNGVQLVTPADDLKKLVEAFPASDRTRLLEAGKTLGVKNAEAILKAYQKNFTKWQGLSKDIGTDVTKFQKALMSEVFDKLDAGKL